MYKAGASLYDGIATVLASYPEPVIDPMIQALGLLDAYQADAMKNQHWDPWQYACHWVQQVPLATCAAFNQHYTGWHSAPSVTAVLPILCVDAPLYEVEVTSEGTIGAIAPVDALWTSARLASWPPSSSYVLNPSRAAVVLVVTASALERILHEAAHWFRAVHQHVLRASPTACVRLPLEMQFLESVRALQAGAAA